MRSIIILFIVLHPFLLYSTIFYVDPSNGSMANDGSRNAPWSTLQEVVESNLIETQSYNSLPYTAGVSQLQVKNANAPVQPGDTILLMDGLHGEFYFRGAFNSKTITIKGDKNQTPVLSRIRLVAGSHWNFENIHVSSEPYGFYLNHRLVYFETHGHHGPAHDIQVKHCEIYSTANSSNWSADDWLQNVSHGIYFSGNNMSADGNICTNVDMGISLIGNGCTVINNQVINFSGDGMRANGKDLLIESNLIKNCYNVDDNHDDGIQSFNLNGDDFSNVIIRSNTIINFEDPNQPHRGSLQGIGCFDGPYNNWIIENNLIVVDHYHGISLYGAYDCRIVNNTVIDPILDGTPGPVWIRITDHKDGTPSANCLVKNNISCRFTVDAEESHNLILNTENQYEEHFVDWQRFDFRLKEGSSAIDSADINIAPGTDIVGNERPSGSGPDIGAFEYQFLSSLYDYSLMNLIAFPNPVLDKITVTLEETPIKAHTIIYNSIGQIVATNTQKPIANQLEFSLHTLKAGSYFAQINGRQGFRFIKI